MLASQSQAVTTHPGTGRWQLPGAVEAFQPAPALLLVPAIPRFPPRMLTVRRNPEVGIELDQAKRTTNRIDRKPEVRH